jgi:uncharacterized membrane protein
MRIDLYTKTILTIIAVLLAVISLKPILQPKPVMAQGNLSGVQFAPTMNGGFWFFDTRSGEVWEYTPVGLSLPDGHRKVTQLGKPLTP